MVWLVDGKLRYRLKEFLNSVVGYRRFVNRKSGKEIARLYANKGSKPRPDKEKEQELAELLPAIYCKIPEEPKNFREFPTEAKLWARAAWWSGKYSVPEIAESIGVKDQAVYTWVRGTAHVKGWAEDKEKEDQKALRKAVKNNSNRMQSLMDKMLTVLEKTVHGIIDENRRLSVDEFTKVTNAFEKIFKLRQLEMGKPTEIFAGDNGELPTWSEIREKLAAVDIPEYEVLESQINGK